MLVSSIILGGCSDVCCKVLLLESAELWFCLPPDLCETGTKLKDFLVTLSAPHFQSEVAKLRHNVEEYSKQFPTIGFDKETMKYKK